MNTGVLKLDRIHGSLLGFAIGIAKKELILAYAEGLQDKKLLMSEGKYKIYNQYMR